jgi:hypothetical protein
MDKWALLLYGSLGIESRPAPSLGSAQENPGEGKQRCRFFPAQQQVCQPFTEDEYCINFVDGKLQNKQKEYREGYQNKKNRREAR